MKRKKLIAARIKKCGEQQVLADRLGVSRTEVSYWENGHKTPHPHYQLELCKLLGFDDPVVLLEIDYTDEEASKSMAPTAESPLQVASSEDGTTEEEAHEESMVSTTESSLQSDQDYTTSSAPIVLSVPSEVQKFIASGLERRLWHIAHTNYSDSSEMTAAIQQAIEESDMMNMGNTTYEINRREAICSLAALPLTTLGQKPALHTKHYAEMLMHCTSALEACWELYRGSDPKGVQHAFECVCTYVPLLETIARNSDACYKEALDLTTRYAILQTMLGWSCTDATETVGYAQKAADLAKETGNILLQLSACTKLGYGYLANRQYTWAWETMQEGEHALKLYQRAKKKSPLPSGVIGSFNSSYAMVQADNGFSPDRALGIATDSEPLKGHIAFIEFTESAQWLEAARTCSAKGDPKQAMKWIGKRINLETLAPRVSQSKRGRFMAINTLTRSLLQSQERDLEKIIEAWSTAIEGANTLKSERLYTKAAANFELMQALYPGERRIMKLIPLTSHW